MSDEATVIGTRIRVTGAPALAVLPGRAGALEARQEAAVVLVAAAHAGVKLGQQVTPGPLPPADQEPRQADAHRVEGRQPHVAGESLVGI